ncbi:copper amine oxidase [Paenibacillus sp. FSL K6-2524]|uniref:copper amine oxidase n=1 Tax=Paenibacillus sp. FSL K6-2524 TaxID=2954516 RepID=UPI0030FA7048
MAEPKTKTGVEPLPHQLRNGSIRVNIPTEVEESMKKFAYMAGAFILGIVVASSAGTVSAQVKSLIGQKVTGEYAVVINGRELADKGAVIDGKTNGPIRAISDAIGGTLSVDNQKKVINITTNSNAVGTGTTEQQSTGPVVGNEYIGQPKASLEKIKAGLENDILAPTIKGRDEIKAGIEQLKASNGGELTQKTIESAEKNLATYEADIEKYTKQLEQVNEALKLLEK